MQVNVRRFLRLFLLQITFTTSAFALVEQDKLWLAVNYQKPLTQDKRWLGLAFAQLRFIDNSHPWQIALWEAAVGYQFYPDTNMWFGYRWMGNNPNNNFYQENRLFQQVIWQIKKDGSKQMISRSRLEEIERTNQNQLAYRIRQRFALEINKPLLADMRPFTYDEIFLQLNQTQYTSSRFISENRLFMGFNIHTSNDAWWEVGYMNQYQMSTPLIPQNQMSHILSITYILLKLNIEVNMQTETHLSFLTLLLMISFASVNAVLFTPALPTIANYFAIANSTAQLTITWFLVGYAIGQLLYGPLANRLGRKPALYAGISLQIISSIICIIAGSLHSYELLVLGRFLLALGSGVGLKMTFTLINEVYAPVIASQKASYLMIAFAITPGLGVMLGGLLNTYFGWQSTFAAGAIYGVILLLMTARLPETKKILDLDALKLNHLIEGYTSQFKNMTLLSGGMLMGSASCFVYVFAAFAPFIAIDMLHMTSAMYGIANLLPPIGLVLGSIYSAKLATRYPSVTIIRLGVLIALIGSAIMLVFALFQPSALLLLFIPMIFCYFGLALVFANASTIALSSTTDKAHGSAVMNFVNMGFVTLIVLGLGFFPTEPLIMPSLFILLTIMMFGLIKLITRK